MTPEKTDIKQKIKDATLKLVTEKGYSKTSARMIAKEVGISVGTLYYHFKEGKFSILFAFMDEFNEELKIDEIITSQEMTEDDIKEFFFKDLDMARKYQEFLKAIEIEQLNNPDYFLKQGRKIINVEQIQQFFSLIEKIAGKKINPLNAQKIIVIWKALIRRHIFMRNLFGSDEDFIKMMVKIIKALADD